MLVPLKNSKSYGVLHTENYFSFIGFSKKVNSEEIQTIDIFLDDKLIDTIIADKHIEKIEDIYELEGFGFNYILPNEYIGQKHIISFKNHETKEHLQNSPYELIDERHPKFNEMAFLNSLTLPIDEEKIKDLYCPNCIGFLATEENLKDERFVDYIKKLIIRFPNSIFKAICFNLVHERAIKEIFTNTIVFLIPLNISSIGNQIEIYICNGSESTDLKIFSLLRTKYPHILSIFTNLQIYNFEKINIKEFENLLSTALKKFMDNYKILCFKENEVSIEKSYTITFQNAVFQRFKLGKDILDINSSAYEYFNFKIIEYALQNNQFKLFYFNLIQKQIEILSDNKET